MRIGITFIGVLCCMLYSAFAQQKPSPAVEEVYGNYITAIGGSEKLKSITNRKDVISINSEYAGDGDAPYQGTDKQEMISFIDPTTQQSAIITKQYPSTMNENKMTLMRTLIANGKTTMLLPDGKKMEMASTHNSFDIFPDTVIPSGSKMLTNETISGQEYYVVNYEKTTNGFQFDCYVYFDIDSGLMTGSKQTNEQENNGTHTKMITLTYFDEYKEIEGILIPHQISQQIKTESKGAFNQTTINNSVTEIIKIEFNTDIEDFKQNCFQNPEECFAQYIKN